MFRFSILAIAVLVLFGVGNSRSTGQNPQPTQPKALPVAPFPHMPDEERGRASNLESAITELDPPQKLQNAFPELSKPNPDNPPMDKPAPIFAGRTGDARRKCIKEFGGTQASERAVALGLAWLARQQKADGSWKYDAGDYKDEITAATGMALLAFLGAGETHTSGRLYRDAVRNGLNWLLTHLPAKEPNTGKFENASIMYSQAIGALALCEAYGMTQDKELLAPAQSAINYIQAAQGPNGSWGYTAGINGDTSITGWQIQALQAARLIKDIKVADMVFRKAIGFLNVSGAGSRKAAYGYGDNASAAPGTSLTSVGLLCRYYIDKWGPDNAGMAEGVLGLMKKSPGAKTKPALDMYFYYYATQVIHFFGGDEWKTWNDGPKQPDGSRKGGMRDWLTDLQIAKDGENRGSWDPESAIIGKSSGRLGTTTLCILTLEVYYRHIPLYKTNDSDAIKIIDK
jgi:hypothetical protein